MGTKTEIEQDVIRQMILGMDELIKANLAPLAMTIYKQNKEIMELLLDIKDPLRRVPVQEKCLKCDYAHMETKWCDQWNVSFQNVDWHAAHPNCCRVVNGKCLEWYEEKEGEK